MRSSLLFALTFVTTIIAPRLAPAHAEASEQDCRTIPAWNSNAIYPGHEIVQQGGRRYQAAWWTQGESPETHSTWGAWALLGDCTYWGPWLDRDDGSGTRDDETLSSHLSEHRTCAKPAAVECRRKSDGRASSSTGEITTCSASIGFDCVNAQQPDGICDDYEVRFLCPGQWSAWIDQETPANGGDFETRDGHFQAGLLACENPGVIECKRVSTVAPGAESENIVCNPAVGLICRSSDQADGACDNYAIRYLCP
jgi:hypothetical protein